MPMRVAMRRWLLPTWLVLVGGWLPWLLVHYPGNVDSDTITQMFEWLNYSQRSDHHPWFDTMVFGWFWDLGHALGSYNYGLFIMLFLQELATALGIALALVYLGRLGLSARARWTLTALLAVFPVFFITPSVLSKDSFAGVFWTPFLILYIEALRTRGRVLLRPWVAAGAILLTIPLILAQRPNLYLVILCVIGLIVVAARGTRWRIAAGTLGVVLVTNVVWGMIVLPAWNVKPGSMTDILSIPLQQTARTVKEHGSSLPASEKQAINAVLRYDGLAKAYVPTRSDAVKGRWSGKATRAQQLEYFKVWFVEMFRYPGTYLAATFNNNYDFAAPLTRINFQSNLSLAHYIPFWHSRAFPTTSVSQISDVANSLHSPHRMLPAIASLNDETAAFMDSTMLLASKALYASWIPLLALAMGIRRRSWFHVLATLPVFVNLAILDRRAHLAAAVRDPVDLRRGARCRPDDDPGRLALERAGSVEPAPAEARRGRHRRVSRGIGGTRLPGCRTAHVSADRRPGHSGCTSTVRPVRADFLGRHDDRQGPQAHLDRRLHGLAAAHRAEERGQHRLVEVLAVAAHDRRAPGRVQAAHGRAEEVDVGGSRRAGDRDLHIAPYR